MVNHSESSRVESGYNHWWLAPMLVASYPVLALYTQSINAVSTREALVSGAVLIAVTLTIAYILRLIIASPTRASLTAVAIITWFFMFQAYRRIGKIVLEVFSTSLFNDYLLILLWLLSLIAIIIFFVRVRWSDSRFKRVCQFVQLAAGFAIAWTLIQGGYRAAQGGTVGVPAYSIWADNTEPVSANWQPVAREPQRDVYFLLFDRYSSGEVLKKYYGFDNSEFYKELESRGFVVDRNATTSYPMTALAMASTLNMRYLSSHFRKISDYYEPIELNEVGQWFEKAGYKYLYFGNQHTPFRKSSNADWNLNISMLPYEFADSLVSMTPLQVLIGRQFKYQFILQKLGKVAAVSQNPEPTFVYAHFLIPHPPYVFSQDGSVVSEFNRVTEPESKLYLNQLIATNQMILKLVDDILGNSPIKPIIFLQADEGAYLMSGDEKLSREDQVAKRIGILNAVLLPDDDIRQKLPQPLLPVNTFRFLFKEYFGGPFSLLPNKMFYWSDSSPQGVPTPNSSFVELPAPSPSNN